VANSIEALSGLVLKFGQCYILGAGSNILAEDSGISKPIIMLGQDFNYIRQAGELVEAGASTKLSSLINYAVKNNLGGLDNLAGIPATIGGLILMNASAFGREISSLLDKIQVITKDGQVEIIKKEAITFSYRSSSLNNFIILRAWFRLEQENNLKEKIHNFMRQRAWTQDFCFPSCGCIFKNTPKGPAGFLIESCGLKGLEKNGAKISSKHANFIVNVNRASYNDVDYLIKRAKESVYKKFGLHLEEEIKRWA
jgi:UDP-N-acetylmuramate dehydrogenase